MVNFLQDLKTIAFRSPEICKSHKVEQQKNLKKKQLESGSQGDLFDAKQNPTYKIIPLKGTNEQT